MFGLGMFHGFGLGLEWVVVLEMWDGVCDGCF